MKPTIFLMVVLSFMLSAAAQEPPGHSGGIVMTEASTLPPPLTGKTRFEGIVRNYSGGFTGGNFSIVIERWSTPEEIAELRRILEVNDQDILLEKVWKAEKAGYMNIGGSMGKPLFFAAALPVDGGYMVRILTDTPISHVGMNSKEYPFGFIEFKVPLEGRDGQGTIVGMAKIKMDAAGMVQVSSFGIDPAKILEVGIVKQKEKRSKKK